jgi:hypothetical protein
VEIDDRAWMSAVEDIGGLSVGGSGPEPFGLDRPEDAQQAEA